MIEKREVLAEAENILEKYTAAHIKPPHGSRWLIESSKCAAAIGITIVGFRTIGPVGTVLALAGLGIGVRICREILRANDSSSR